MVYYLKGQLDFSIISLLEFELIFAHRNVPGALRGHFERRKSTRRSVQTELPRDVIYVNLKYYRVFI